jgi:nicotinamidase-related amidase
MDALVIIDVQRGMFGVPEMQPFDGEATVKRIRRLLDQARSESTPIFFVQHDGAVGHPLAAGSPGFPFHEALMPGDGELVTVKRHCNAFQETDLEAHLRASGADRFIVTGMQSNYCIDTFVRAAVERGFKICLVADGHTTFDTPVLKADQIIAHHNHTLDGSFAEVIRAEEITLVV